MIGAVLALFRGLPILWQLASIATVLLMLGGAWFGVSRHYYNQGWEAHAAAVAAQDRRAIDASIEARKKVDDCFAAGGTWSDALGMCDK